MTGEQLTRWTIDGALVAYVISLALMLGARGGREERRPASTETFVRIVWMTGCVLLWLHMACVFQFYHDWSHTHAFEHTARETREIVGIDFGGGLWFNYAFAAVWTIDVLWWWLAPLSYRNRPILVTVLAHFYLAFIIFNATIVFKTGLLRWGGIVATMILGIILFRRRAAFVLREADLSFWGCTLIVAIVVNTCLRIEFLNHENGGYLPRKDLGTLNPKWRVAGQENVRKSAERMIRQKAINDEGPDMPASDAHYKVHTNRPLSPDENAFVQRELDSNAKRTDLYDSVSGMGLWQYFLAPLGLAWSIKIVCKKQATVLRVIACLFAVISLTAICLMFYRGYFTSLGLYS